MAIITYKSQIGYEDIEWYKDGGSETFSRPTTTGGTITLHKLFAPNYPCAISEAFANQVYIYALDVDTEILHQWGGNYYWMTNGNGPDALGIIYKK